MKALLKFCCFSPPQTLDSQGSLHFKRLDGDKTVGSKDSNKVLGSASFEPRTRVIHLLLVELGAACRLLATHHGKGRYGGAGNADERTFRVTGGRLCLELSKTIFVLCCPKLQVRMSIFTMCRLLGLHANTSNQQHVLAEGDDCNAGSALLQNQLPAQVTVLHSYASLYTYTQRSASHALGP